MGIQFSSQSGNFSPVHADFLKKWITKVVNHKGCLVCNINYLFCDDDFMLDTNKRFLNHDTYTDIITFDYVAGNLLSGDIIISVDRVADNAHKYGVDFHQEMLRVIIHGVLHLLGYKDKNDEDAAEMRRQEESAIALWETMFPGEQVS